MVTTAGPGRRGRGGGRDEAGLALVAVLMAMLLTGVALALLAASLQVRLRGHRQEAREVRLTALADAAVAATLAELAVDWGSPGLGERPYAGGRFASRIEWLDSDHRLVTARAVLGGSERVVAAQVASTAHGLRVSGWRRLPRGSF